MKSHAMYVRNADSASVVGRTNQTRTEHGGKHFLKKKRLVCVLWLKIYFVSYFSLLFRVSKFILSLKQDARSLNINKRFSKKTTRKKPQLKAWETHLKCLQRIIKCLRFRQQQNSKVPPTELRSCCFLQFVREGGSFLTQQLKFRTVLIANGAALAVWARNGIWKLYRRLVAVYEAATNCIYNFTYCCWYYSVAAWATVLV